MDQKDFAPISVKDKGGKNQNFPAETMGEHPIEDVYAREKSQERKAIE
ncbi:hypothetical protein [Leptospira perolatii]|nr:hypothetical protein [Leptospira perolatii]